MTCPECKGTGTYTGLTAAEPCKACAGTGKADLIVEDYSPLLQSGFVRAPAGTITTTQEHIKRYYEGVILAAEVEAMTKIVEARELRWLDGVPDMNP